MGYLADGDRVFDAVQYGDLLGSDLNTWQDQEIAAVQERWLPAHSMCIVPAGSGWTMTAAGHWEVMGGLAGEKCYFPVTLRSGEKIMDIEVEVASNCSAGVGGTIYFYYGRRGLGVSTSIDLTKGAANPWQTGGIGYANRTTYTYTHADASLPITIDPQYFYQFEFVAPTEVAVDAEIWDVRIRTQFGA